MGQILMSKWPIFSAGTHCENRYFSDANYSIKHNSNVLLSSVLQINMCLRIQNLKKIGNWFTNKGTRAISIRGVFNKNIVNFSLFVTKNLNCYEMANYGQISIVKVL